MTAIVSASHAVSVLEEVRRALEDYRRSAHEVLLLGVRGKLPIRDNSWLDESSPSVHALAEIASPLPYLDLFGTAVGS